MQRLGGGTAGAGREVSEENRLPNSRGSLSGPYVSTLLPSLQSDSYQEDIYPMTPGTEPALTPDEWLGGINRGTVRVGFPEEASRTAAFAFTRVHPFPLCMASARLPHARPAAKDGVNEKHHRSTLDQPASVNVSLAFRRSRAHVFEGRL